MAAPALARIAWKMTPDDEAEPVTVGFACSDGEEVRRVLSRKVADKLELGDFCAKTEIPDDE